MPSHRHSAGKVGAQARSRRVSHGTHLPPSCRVALLRNAAVAARHKLKHACAQSSANGGGEEGMLALLALLVLGVPRHPPDTRGLQSSRGWACGADKAVTSRHGTGTGTVARAGDTASCK